MVGACGIARTPLASLGLGLTAALRVRLIPTLAPLAALLGTQPAPGKRGKEDLMNRCTGSGHLTKDRKFLETESATASCTRPRARGLPRDLS